MALAHFSTVETVSVTPRTDRPSIDLGAAPADPRLTSAADTIDCLRDAVLPWRRIGGETVVLSDRPWLDPARHRALTDRLGPIRLSRCAPGAAEAALVGRFGPALARDAEQRVPLAQSCRGWDHRRAAGTAMRAVAVLVLATAFFPLATALVLLGWCVLTLVCGTALKIAAAVIDLVCPRHTSPVAASPEPAHLPVVSLLVPLYREREVAAHLLTRIDGLDYPRDRLDLCLVLEDDDQLTRVALAEATLPPWARVIEVPQGTLRTKPRALNYALRRARGTIVGIYDAEDTPAPDQLRRIVQRFAERGADVACLQGMLDYWNARSNWIARCFAIEYATWFRLILPGLDRMGLVVPLGGTTLFLRRDAIEAVGGWDAHNVTEDADLGLRLARAGYRTELIDSVTMEEANARAWPWVRQRSRWLKGYAMTWRVHMADPVALWRDIGGWRFFGVQVLFLGTFSQFLLAPVLWSLWLVLLGLPHPLDGVVPPAALWTLGLTFLVAEAASLAVAALAVRRSGRPWLALWAPAMQVYFPLATLAAWKALSETLTRPFYWDKTSHGHYLAMSVPPAPEATAGA